MRSNFKAINVPEIAVSLLDSDLAYLAVIAENLENNGVKIFHLDVMDGHFVKNLTFGPPVIKSLRKYSKVFFNVHLMIENPQRWYTNYIDAGADLIVFHYEALKNKTDIEKLILNIKKLGVACGISIKPKTDIVRIYPFLKLVDLVLVMTVEPGFGGQKILRRCIRKVKQLYQLKQDKNFNFFISCDGGINETNIKEILKLGCDIPVIGNAIFCSEDYTEKVKIFKELTNKLKFRK
ncbi:MAG: ribulose-phosphate 3-epimerase [Endomicrobia bacterium]|nr:ribulose-phosphate 3-epimerase [Endomicrobiia bacterium]